MRIYSYSKTGSYHIKNHLVNQDYCSYKKIDEHFVIAAIADGLGSETHSDIAAKLAVTTCIDYSSKHINKNDNQEKILKEIRNAFDKANKNIIDFAKLNYPKEIYEFDTTLLLVIYLNGIIYYGNAGDSGAIILKKDGSYEQLTKQQNDELGGVFPLDSCKTWEFNVKKDVGAILLATDGIYNLFIPKLFKYHSVPVYVHLLEFFMNKDKLKLSLINDKELNKRMETFISSSVFDVVYDDKTVLFLLDESIKTNRKEEDYYKSPNISNLKKRSLEDFNKLAYPHLFKEKE